MCPPARPGSRHATKVLGRQDDSQKRLLRLGAMGDRERPTGVRRTHHEDADHHPLSGDRGVELPDVNLRLRVSVVGPRDTDLDVDPGRA